jgi:hypothetical protein
MTDGGRVLAALWTSAWVEGGGDAQITALGAVDQGTLVSLYQDHDFAYSYTLTTIAPILHT